MSPFFLTLPPGFHKLCVFQITFFTFLCGQQGPWEEEDTFTIVVSFSFVVMLKLEGLISEV